MLAELRRNLAARRPRGQLTLANVGQRLDKWLWCARLVKTRTLAAKLIVDGKVRVNGERALKVSRHVRLGDVVTGIRRGRRPPVRCPGCRRGRAARAGDDCPVPLRGPHARGPLPVIGACAGRGPSRPAADQARPQAARRRSRPTMLEALRTLDRAPNRTAPLAWLALYWVRDWDRQGPSSAQVSGAKLGP